MPKKLKLDPTFAAFRKLRTSGRPLSAKQADDLMKLAFKIAKSDPATGPVGQLDVEQIFAGIPAPAFGLGVGISAPTVDHAAFRADYAEALAAERADREAAADVVAATIKAAISAAGVALL